MADQRIQKWAGWLGGSIEANVVTMHLRRATWRKVSKMLAEKSDALSESHWWEFMRDTYATTQAVAVRRQADTMKGVGSLGKLLQEVSKASGRLTREHLIEVQVGDGDPYWVQVAERAWAEHYGGDVHDSLDPAIPAADLGTLTDEGARVRHYVDKHVAHADAAAPEVTLTLDEVHDAIDTIGHLFKTYDSLIRGVGWTGLEPVIPRNWMEAFTVPWTKARDSPRTRS